MDGGAFRYFSSAREKRFRTARRNCGRPRAVLQLLIARVGYRRLYSAIARAASRSRLSRTGRFSLSSWAAIFEISACGRYFVGQLLRARSINLPTVASNFESGTEERKGSELVCDFVLVVEVSWFAG
jgi:hypothetical protein